MKNIKEIIKKNNYNNEQVFDLLLKFKQEDKLSSLDLEKIIGLGIDMFYENYGNYEYREKYFELIEYFTMLYFSRKNIKSVLNDSNSVWILIALGGLYNQMWCYEKAYDIFKLIIDDDSLSDKKVKIAVLENLLANHIKYNISNTEFEYYKSILYKLDNNSKFFKTI